IASPEVSVRWPMAPRSLIVRMPILIPFPLIAAPLPPLTALYRPLRPLPPGPMRHERQLHHLRRHALAADVDLERGAVVRQRPGPTSASHSRSRSAPRQYSSNPSSPV